MSLMTKLEFEHDSHGNVKGVVFSENVELFFLHIKRIRNLSSDYILTSLILKISRLDKLGFSFQKCLLCDKIFLSSNSQRNFCSRRCALYGWRNRHKDIINARNREFSKLYYKRNRLKKIEEARQYRRLHPERIRLQRRSANEKRKRLLRTFFREYSDDYSAQCQHIGTKRLGTLVDLSVILVNGQPRVKDAVILERWLEKHEGRGLHK